jgi:SAM-dependent methyltransferase
MERNPTFMHMNINWIARGLFEKGLGLFPTQLRKIVFFGRSRYCPVCKSGVRAFWRVEFGATPRNDARCPVCDSVERHRLIWVFLSEQTNLLDEIPKKILHVAPEPGLAQCLSGQPGIDYLSADFESPSAMEQMDLRDIKYPDGSFDVVLCSHVLEHIEEDRKAIAEIFRVLKKGGWALLQVPIMGRETDEDLNIRDPIERERRFGQHDHVRACGLDYCAKYEDEGFSVSAVPAVDVAGPIREQSWGLLDDMTPVLFVCRKE